MNPTSPPGSRTVARPVERTGRSAVRGTVRRCVECGDAVGGLGECDGCGRFDVEAVPTWLAAELEQLRIEFELSHPIPAAPAYGPGTAATAAAATAALDAAELDAAVLDAAVLDTVALDAAAPDAAATMDARLDRLTSVQAELSRLELRRTLLVADAVESACRDDELARDDAVRRGERIRGGLARAREISRRSALAELACALRESEHTVERLAELGRMLRERLPATSAAVERGELGYRRACVIAETAMALPASAHAEFEATLLPVADRTPAQLRRRASALRERLHPDPLSQRHESARADRRVAIEPECDGMAWLHALLPSADAARIDARLGACADALLADDEPRTRAQLRADALVDLLLDGTGARSGAPGADGSPGASIGGLRGGDTPRTASTGGEARRAPRLQPSVSVTVPVLALLGRSDEPAELDGYGPIDAETARLLAAEAPSFHRILTHPETGAVLSVGRDSYAVPASLRALLRVRDGTCRFPGCNRPARRSEIDHSVDWQHGGATAHDNLAHLCSRHHHLKHEHRWRVDHEPGGVLRWRSPAGREYTTTPDPPPF